MNFLAHAYLSFREPDIIVGNLIADLVKGKQIDSFPDEIRRGIYIHRQIDAYTDSHPATLNAKQYLNESAGRYWGSFLDVAYDHFLATDPLNIPKSGWSDFAQYCYAQIEKRTDILPSRFCSMYMYMRSEDWLNSYQNRWMIERSFERLKRRASYLDDDAPVYADFEKNYDMLREHYEQFFPDLKNFVKSIS